MKLYLFILLPLLLAPAYALAEDPLQPFTWSYDITYNTGKTTYTGTGSYTLVKIDKEAEKTKKIKKRDSYPSNAEYTFTAAIETNSNTFSSTDTSWMISDAKHLVVPLQRRQKFTILGFPKRRDIPLTPVADKGYYDEISVVLFLHNQIKQYVQGKSPENSWQVWLADRDKEETYSLTEDETISTPLGQIDCHVLTKEDKKGKRSFKVWLAKDGLYIAKVESTNGKERTLMEINAPAS